MDWKRVLGKDWQFPVTRLIILLVATVGLGFFDFALYQLLEEGQHYGKLTIHEKSTVDFSILVKGEGPVAQAVRSVLQYKYPPELINRKFDTSHCYTEHPYSYDKWSTIVALLLLSLMVTFFVVTNLFAPKLKGWIRTRV